MPSLQELFAVLKKVAHALSHLRIAVYLMQTPHQLSLANILLAAHKDTVLF
jgi:hypothetical protein